MTQPTIKTTGASCEAGDTIIVKFRTTTETSAFAPRGPFDQETTIAAAAGRKGGTVNDAVLLEAASSLLGDTEPDAVALYGMRTGDAGTGSAVVLSKTKNAEYSDFICEGEDGKLYVFLEARLSP